MRRLVVIIAVGLALLIRPLLAQESGWERQERLIDEMLTRPATPLEMGADEEQEEPIETDRDSFTPATTVVGQRRAVLESAWSFIDNRSVRDTHSYPELLTRLGITDAVELRLGYNYEVGGANSDISSSAGNEFQSAGRVEDQYAFSYGIKGRLSEQQSWMPRSVVIVNGVTPQGGRNNDSSLVAAYAAGWQLLGGWQWDNSLRYQSASDGSDHFHVWTPSTVLKLPLGEKWTTHVEYFALFTDQKSDNLVQHYVSPGAHYRLTPDLEIGLRLGWGLSHDAANFFSNAGIGWRY